jgi:hypothetical protein
MRADGSEALRQAFALWGPPGLLLVGFLGWTVFALLPGFEGSAAGRPFRIREAWDTVPYFAVGLPVMFAVQAAAAYFDSAHPLRGPLWLIGGHALGIALVHPAGTSLGLLPLAILFVGLPLYVLFVVAALIGRGLARVTGQA